MSLGRIFPCVFRVFFSCPLFFRSLVSLGLPWFTLGVRQPSSASKRPEITQNALVRGFGA